MEEQYPQATRSQIYFHTCTFLRKLLEEMLYEKTGYNGKACKRVQESNRARYEKGLLDSGEGKTKVAGQKTSKRHPLILQAGRLRLLNFPRVK